MLDFWRSVKDGRIFKLKCEFFVFFPPQKDYILMEKRGSILCVIKQQIVDFCEITKSQHAKKMFVFRP